MSHTAVHGGIYEGVNNQKVVLVIIINDQTGERDAVSYCAAGYSEQQAIDFAAARVKEADAVEAIVAPDRIPGDAINEAIADGQVIVLATSGGK